MGNIDQGEKVFKQCAACHSISKSGGNKIGPALWGVIGRKIGSITDYKYSKGMGEFGGTWSFNSINTFSSHSAIFSIVSIDGPSEFPCPGKSIDKTLKFLFEKNCSVRDQTMCERPLPCRNTIVSLELSMPCPASEA